MSVARIGVRLGLLGLVLLVSSASGIAVAREAETDPAKVVVTGVDDPRMASFDRLMREFLATRKIPGAALAVSRRGRLVYARGFGLADLETAQAVEPGALFRIASVSKPLTAVTVLHLADRQKFSLDDPVLDLLGPGVFGGDGPPADPRWASITVRQVLQHRGGWDREASFDPMFRAFAIAREFGVEPPAGPDLIVRSMLRRKLDFEPGARYAYSNFGYCLLGRLIEKVTGEPYERAVQTSVLEPLGVRGRALRLGHTALGDRAAGEVHYYARDRKAPYGTWSLEALDAHGGWIATAPALVKFAAAFDPPAACQVLSAGAIETMFERPPGRAGFRRDGKPKASYYGCGWQVRPVGDSGVNAFHNGSLPGTSSLLVRRFDGLCWAVLFNTRETPDAKDKDKKEPAEAIDPLLHKAAAAVVDWPETDLFSRREFD